MSELRDDPVTGRVVLLAPGRAARPHTVAAPMPGPAAVEGCPFCPGNERETPPERCRTGEGAPDTPGGRVRVVPNLYPIVGGADGAPVAPGARGAHEVAILDPDHSCDLGRMTDPAVEELFGVLRDRARVHAAAGLAHVQVLVNHGRAAGASIAHPHAQVIAIDFVPPAVRDQMKRFADARTDVVAVDFEASGPQGGRIVDTDAVWAWAPWAAASPYETRDTAPAAGPRLEDAPDTALAAVARTTRDVVAGIGRLLGDFAYNVVLHNAPTGDLVGDRPTPDDAPFHWYVSVVPRVATVAGFELGTGVLVNTRPPADAAADLRAALAEGVTA
jgi:UDPglucose--hexose-1-phosphate uridylyltransferase